MWKLRFPLPSNKGDEHLPDNIQTLVDHMMEKTQSTKDTNQWLQDSEQFNRYIESAYYELEEETSEV
ncbi:hypothetical protein [Vibrio mediterranei]|uniref:hypothetical protein n=1 Tax=Vibrio mediterranei TaxID=689 RepID=UPI001C11F7AF|nr:hypothetical protein [Vibrio mediterranei]